MPRTTKRFQPCLVAFWLLAVWGGTDGASGLLVADGLDWVAAQREDVLFLASDQLRGRSVADETIHEAADYIASRMQQIGLRTDLFDGKPFQSLEIPLGARAGAVARNRISFQRTASTFAPSEVDFSVGLGSGMNPLAIGREEATFRGPIAFVGFGITAPKQNYDDYAGIDVQGAAVMMLRKEPRSDDERVFDGKRNSRHAFFTTKIENAIAHGAAAVILVNDSSSVADDISQKQRHLEQERERKEKITAQLAQLPESAVNSRQSLVKQLAVVESMIGAAENDLHVAQSGLIPVGEAGSGSQQEKRIPILAVSRPVASRLLAESMGKTIDELEHTIEETLRPQSKLLETWRVDLEVQLEPTIAKTSNVIGILPGRGDLKRESVVIGAHYDHIGMGGFGSLAPGTIAVHNGADDNASGTAVMLGAATQLKSRLNEVANHRRMIFIAFTGEERGLLGSKHYASRPRFPLESTVAMINLDMVGRLRDNELTLYGTGSAEGMNDLVDRINERHRFNLFRVESGYGPSDHQSFYEVGVPVLFFFTGLHNDYHRPSDDSDKIDFGGMARITDMVCDAALEFAVSHQVPRYTKTNSENVQIRRQLTVYLGVTLSQQNNQISISSVMPGAPADRSGLRVGDVIQVVGKSPIHRVADLMERLRQYSPGQTLNIEVMRNNRLISIPIKLEARPRTP